MTFQSIKTSSVLLIACGCSTYLCYRKLHSSTEDWCWHPLETHCTLDFSDWCIEFSSRLGALLDYREMHRCMPWDTSTYTLKNQRLIMTGHLYTTNVKLKHCVDACHWVFCATLYVLVPDFNGVAAFRVRQVQVLQAAGMHAAVHINSSLRVHNSHLWFLNQASMKL